MKPAERRTPDAGTCEWLVQSLAEAAGIRLKPAQIIRAAKRLAEDLEWWRTKQ